MGHCFFSVSYFIVVIFCFVCLQQVAILVRYENTKKGLLYPFGVINSASFLAGAFLKDAIFVGYPVSPPNRRHAGTASTGMMMKSYWRGDTGPRSLTELGEGSSEPGPGLDA